MQGSFEEGVQGGGLVVTVTNFLWNYSKREEGGTSII